MKIGVSKQISKREALVKQIVNKAACGDRQMIKIMRELIGNSEDREDEAVQGKSGQTARERLSRKLDELSARMHQRLEQLCSDQQATSIIQQRASSTANGGSS